MLIALQGLSTNCEKVIITRDTNIAEAYEKEFDILSRHSQMSKSLLGY